MEPLGVLAGHVPNRRVLARAGFAILSRDGIPVHVRIGLLCIGQDGQITRSSINRHWEARVFLRLLAGPGAARESRHQKETTDIHNHRFPSVLVTAKEDITRA